MMRNQLKIWKILTIKQIWSWVITNPKYRLNMEAKKEFLAFLKFMMILFLGWLKNQSQRLDKVLSKYSKHSRLLGNRRSIWRAK